MIKMILKRNNLPLAQVAKDLNISRPTLDTYIELYEEGRSLPNSLFQNIFDFLFSDTDADEYAFAEKYNYIKDYYGKRSNLASDLPPPDTSEPEKCPERDIFDAYLSYISGQKRLGKISVREKKLFTAIFKAESETESAGDMNYDIFAYEKFRAACNEKYAEENPDESALKEEKIAEILADAKNLSGDEILLLVRKLLER